MTPPLSQRINIVRGLNHIGNSHGGKTTKIHTLTDALGNPLHFILTAGHYNDNPQAFELLKFVSVFKSNVIGDRAYDAQALRDHIIKRGGTYTIPPKQNIRHKWVTDWWQYKERHLIEGFFNRLKHFRHIATRFDKLAKSSLAFIQIAAVFLLTK